MLKGPSIQYKIEDDEQQESMTSNHCGKATKSDEYPKKGNNCNPRVHECVCVCILIHNQFLQEIEFD
jgi:hypothetical protein